MKNSSLKLLITGGNGQLAQAIHLQATNCFELIMPNRMTLDITQPDSIEVEIQKYQPDFVVNTAAYTAVDKAEQETELAYNVNQHGAKNIAIACERHRIPLIHLSTDYVFDGKIQHPYREQDTTHPLNIYGKTKWLGEEEIRQHNENHLILRVSGVFSQFGNNFLRTILKLAKTREELRIVADQTLCPTYAGDIAEAIFSLVTAFKRGTYHYCSTEPASWFEFTNAIIEKVQQRTTLAVKHVTPISTAEFNAAAKRPAYSALDCTKIKQDFQIQLPSWRDGITSAITGLFYDIPT